MYLIDRSASTGPNGVLQAAATLVSEEIARLKPTTKFRIIVYNRRAENLSLGGNTEWTPPTREHQQQAREALAALRAEGGTNHSGALQRALLLQADQIVLVTDSLELRAEALESLRRQNPARAGVSVIELRPPHAAPGEARFRELLTSNGSR